MIMRMVTMLMMLMLPSPLIQDQGHVSHQVGHHDGDGDHDDEMLMLAKMAFMRPTPSSLPKAMFLTRW